MKFSSWRFFWKPCCLHTFSANYYASSFQVLDTVVLKYVNEKGPLSNDALLTDASLAGSTCHPTLVRFLVPAIVVLSRMTQSIVDNVCIAFRAPLMLLLWKRSAKRVQCDKIRRKNVVIWWRRCDVSLEAVVFHLHQRNLVETYIKENVLQES